MASKVDIWLTDQGLAKIEAWRRDGCTIEECRLKMGIANSTLRRWRDEHPEIAEAMRRGADDFDDEVEEALMKAALGYDYEFHPNSKAKGVTPWDKSISEDTQFVTFEFGLPDLWFEPAFLYEPENPLTLNPAIIEVFLHQSLVTHGNRL